MELTVRKVLTPKLIKELNDTCAELQLSCECECDEVGWCGECWNVVHCKRSSSGTGKKTASIRVPVSPERDRP